MHSRPTLRELIAFNLAILEQAIAVAEQCRQRGLDYAQLAGPHLRHVMDHHAALLRADEGHFLDYDHRARERALEIDPALAIARLRELGAALEGLQGRSAGEAVSVGLTIGTDGDRFMVCGSSLGRELQFLASHAIHHYALIKPALCAAGLSLPEGFGKAPDTIRHEREHAAP